MRRGPGQLRPPRRGCAPVGSKDTTGTVTNVEADAFHSIDDKPATRVDVEFSVGGEKYHANFYTIDSAEIARARAPGARLDIHYATVYPGFARVDGHTFSFFGWIGLAFFILPMIGAGIWFGAWRSNRREIRAFIHGTPVYANIIARTYDRSTKSTGCYARLITWQFMVDGKTYDGSISNMDATFLDAAIPGEQLIAVYDPKDPAINTAWLE